MVDMVARAAAGGDEGDAEQQYETEVDHQYVLFHCFPFTLFGFSG